jgi:cytochrome c oxidase accessory protein FixG
LAYIIGKEELFNIIKSPVADHVAGFLSITAFTGIFYGVFAHFREQACIVVCPYGRLQGVLLDKNSVVIGYDYKRGESRAKFNKNKNRTEGDCIDCNQFVDVCPTGIDIRNGTQLECINCTACIDACDFMMEKVNLKKGLIRLTSENAISSGSKFKITPKIIGYAALFIFLISTLAILISTRSDMDAVVLRKPGMMYQERKNGDIANMYELKVINKTFKNYDLKIESLNPDFIIEVLGPGLHLNSQDKTSGEFFLVIKNSKIVKNSYTTKIKISAGDHISKIVETKFIAPVKNI